MESGCCGKYLSRRRMILYKSRTNATMTIEAIAIPIITPVDKPDVVDEESDVATFVVGEVVAVFVSGVVTLVVEAVGKVLTSITATVDKVDVADEDSDVAAIVGGGVVL